MLLSLRSNESDMRRRMASCDDLCAMLFSLYRSARAAEAVAEGPASAPASAHCQCALVRDFVDALNQMVDLVHADMLADMNEDSLPSTVYKTLHGGIHEAAKGGIKLLREVGVTIEPDLHLVFEWRAAMQALQQKPAEAGEGMRRMGAVAARVAAETQELLDPVAGPVAEERANLFSATKRLRGQIEHIRGLVQRKCDSVEDELRAVQTAIVKAQSQTMALVRGLTGIGEARPK